VQAGLTLSAKNNGFSLSHTRNPDPSNDGLFIVSGVKTSVTWDSSSGGPIPIAKISVHIPSNNLMPVFIGSPSTKLGAMSGGVFSNNLALFYADNDIYPSDRVRVGILRTVSASRSHNIPLCAINAVSYDSKQQTLKISATPLVDKGTTIKFVAYSGDATMVFDSSRGTDLITAATSDGAGILTLSSDKIDLTSLKDR
jgi:hypothetical protein